MKMKFKKLLVLFAFFVSTLGFAQRPENREGSEKIKAMKVGMITQELQLTEQQAEKFWPVYNTYSKEKFELNRKIRYLSRTSANKELANDELLKNQEEILVLKHKEIDIDKKYREGFLKIISAQQYAKLIDTENKFNRMLLEKLRERREKN
jgi:Spy/CpxP family protein refolding chaperone